MRITYNVDVRMLLNVWIRMRAIIQLRLVVVVDLFIFALETKPIERMAYDREDAVRFFPVRLAR